MRQTRITSFRPEASHDDRGEPRHSPRLKFPGFFFRLCIKVAYFSFIRVQEVYTINVQI